MTKQELKEIIREDKAYYFGGFLLRIWRIITHNPLYLRGKYIIVSRKEGYYRLHHDTLAGKLLYAWYARKKNILGERLHIELGPAEFGRRLKIFHNDIVVNIGAVIGDDCELYGNNCIGNRGSAYPPCEAPLLGKHVSVGVGAQIIGRVKIGNHIMISSMSLVNKDVNDTHSVWGGIPVRKLRDLKEDNYGY